MKEQLLCLSSPLLLTNCLSSAVSYRHLLTSLKPARRVQAFTQQGADNVLQTHLNYILQQPSTHSNKVDLHLLSLHSLQTVI